MTEKTKKRLAILSASAIGLGMAVAIGLQFTRPKAGQEAPPPIPPSSSQAGSTAPELLPVPELPAALPETSPVSRPSEALPPQTDLPQQQLQPPVTKPAPPKSKPALAEGADVTNPEAPPEYAPGATEQAPAPAPPPAPPAQPQGGGGLPGFGEVPNGGANTGAAADDMYENGNKIGDMA